MKTIGIVTHYAVHNHGAQLQMYALWKILSEMGNNVEILQFEKDYRYLSKDANVNYSISFKSIPFYLKYLLQKGFSKTLFNVRKKRIFDRFRNDVGFIGRKYTDFDGDLIVVGSDEVFSVETGVTDAFWGVDSKTRKIISYAASFGPTTLEEILQKKLSSYISEGVRNFSAVSVRDENSLAIINSMSDKNSVKVCDPVILYGYENEQKTSVSTKEKYILVYSYDKNMNDCNEIQMVKNVAKKLGCKLYSVGFYHKWCDKNINVSPLDLPSWFKSAEYVITDTFHGTVISLITNSIFAVKIRGNANKLENLLGEYYLKTRIFNDEKELLKILETVIDYAKVNEMIENYRDESMKFLQGAVV